MKEWKGTWQQNTEHNESYKTLKQPRAPPSPPSKIMTNINQTILSKQANRQATNDSCLKVSKKPTIGKNETQSPHVRKKQKKFDNDLQKKKIAIEKFL